MSAQYEKALERGYLGTVPAEKNPKDAQTASGSPAAGPARDEKPAEQPEEKAPKAK